MKTPENIEKFLKKFYDSEQTSLKSDSEKIKQVVEDALSAYRETLNKRQVFVQQNTWKIILKRTFIKFATAAVIVIAILLSITFFDKGTTPAYGINEAFELIKQTRTLYVKGWRFKGYHPKDFDTEVTAKLPFEHWYDFEGRRYRLEDVGFYCDGTLYNDPTICDGEYEMSVGWSWRTTGEHWKSIKFEEADKEMKVTGWLDFYGKLNNIEGAKKIDEKALGGEKFDVWEIEVTSQTRENEEITGYRIQTWISPDTLKIGRIKEWRKDEGGLWVQTHEYTDFEWDVVLNDDLFVTEPPKGDGYRLENTKETAFELPEKDGLDDIYDNAKWDYAPLAYWVEPVFHLNNGSFLACWRSVDASESKDQTKYFKNLKIGGALPKLPAEVYAFSPRPNVRDMQFVGFHLAYTRKETEKGPRWYEWGLYVPDKEPPSPTKLLGYQIHYRDNTGENKQMSLTQVSFDDGQNIESKDDFDLFVIEAMKERSDDGFVPEHVTYEKVLRLSEELYDLLTQQ